MRIREEIREYDGLAFPGKTFADAVLEPVFNTQRDHYYHAFLEISLAHAVMLREQNIITEADAKGIIRGLNAVGQRDFSNASYDPRYEDMFFMLEKALSEEIGADLAGRLHIARSRNDVGICQFRMALRLKVLGCMEAVSRFMETLLNVASDHVDTLMPAYTHTQPAQPTTLAHYLLAFYDGLERSMKRLSSAYHCVNLSPIGAAAITTTGFPISRERMCALLGFDGLVENSYDAIAGVDYLTETASALVTLGVDLSRFLKDTLDFCTREYGYYRLADPYVQISSIMPQKRNPSSLEHARPIASALISNAQAAFALLHNTPFGDMVDSEEQLQPYLYNAVTCAVRVLSLLTVNFATMEIQKDLMCKRAGEGFITATELADTLVREKGLSFRESHRITSTIIRALHARGLTQEDLHAELLQELLGGDTPVDEALIRKALDPGHFVKIRGATGGPAPSELLRMLHARQQRFIACREETQALAQNLTLAKNLLKASLGAYTAD